MAGDATEDTRSVVRRLADRDLFKLIERETGMNPDQLVRKRKVRCVIRHTCRALIALDMQYSPSERAGRKSEERQIEARVLDLSEGGALLFARHEFVAGARVRVSVKLPEGATIEAGSEVRWSVFKEETEGYAIGVQFTSIDDRDKRRLLKFLADLDASLGMGLEAEE